MHKLVRVYVVQCTRSGMFLDWEQQLTRSFKHAAITDQQENALDTAMLALGNDFELHSFFVTQEKLDHFHAVGI